MEEQKYPIYKFSARWNQDTYERNSASCSKMFRTKLTAQQEADELEKWWKGVLEAPRDKDPLIKDLHPKLLELSIKYDRDDTWCLRWFAHITFNQFENEQEAFRSFDRFVREKLPLHVNNDMDRQYLKEHPEITTYCLMGAEEHWRWNLCHCEECKKEGITAILH